MAFSTVEAGVSKKFFGVTVTCKDDGTKHAVIVLDWRHIVIFALILSYILYLIFPPPKPQHITPQPHDTKDETMARKHNGMEIKYAYLAELKALRSQLG